MPTNEDTTLNEPSFETMVQRSKTDIDGLRVAARVLTPVWQKWIGEVLDEIVSLRAQVDANHRALPIDGSVIDLNDSQLLDVLDREITGRNLRWVAHAGRNPVIATAPGSERHGLRDAVRALLVLMRRPSSIHTQVVDRGMSDVEGSAHLCPDAAPDFKIDGCGILVCEEPTGKPTEECSEEQALFEAAITKLSETTTFEKVYEDTELNSFWALWKEARAAKPGQRAPEEFQARVQPWMMACFGPEIAADTQERNHRFLEEALELVQACGATASEAHQLVDYVYGRPVGDKHQEIGGVMVTLAALCLAQGQNMHAAGEMELARIWTKVEQIRAKQAAKPKHSPLPEHPRDEKVQPEAEKAERALKVLRDLSQWMAVGMGMWKDGPTGPCLGDIVTEARHVLSAHHAQLGQ